MIPALRLPRHARQRVAVVEFDGVERDDEIRVGGTVASFVFMVRVALPAAATAVTISFSFATRILRPS